MKCAAASVCVPSPYMFSCVLVSCLSAKLADSASISMDLFNGKHLESVHVRVDVWVNVSLVLQQNIILELDWGQMHSYK